MTNDDKIYPALHLICIIDTRSAFPGKKTVTFRFIPKNNSFTSQISIAAEDHKNADRTW